MRTKRRSPVSWIVTLLIVGGLAFGGYSYWKKPATAPVEYRTMKVSRGDIVQTVTANGQLLPVRNVQVGSQISGTIKEMNVDFNSLVKEGQILARIDPATYERNLAQMEAELANSTAGLELAKLNFKRARELFANKLISEADFNQAEVNLQQAGSVVKMREANVDRAKVDLDRTTIYAPIDGIVISRNIEVGQTVAASFSTPTLFLIANDLRKMQIEAAVSEADVGGVTEGQRVTFLVDAFPTRQFEGTVKQVRYAATTNQNVVTYTTVVEVDNPDMKLRPGMTANASIVIAEQKNVLHILNSALRFRPPEGAVVTGVTNAPAKAGSSTNSAGTNAATQMTSSEMPVPPWAAERRRPTQEEREKYEASLTPEQREQYRQMRDRMRARMAEGGGGGGGFGDGGGGFGGGGFGGTQRPTQEGPAVRTLYILEKAAAGTKAQPVLKAVTVKTGISDGTNSEVTEGLNEGDEVVIGVVMPDSSTAATPGGSSPFGGPFGRRGR